MRRLIIFFAITMIALSSTMAFAEASVAPEPRSPEVTKGTPVTVILEDMDHGTRASVMSHLADVKKEAEKAAAAAKQVVKDEVTKATNKTAVKVTEVVTGKIADASINDISKWTKALTGAVKDMCHDLNVEVNEFAKTPVGLGLVGAIAYKMFGADLLTACRDIGFGTVWVMLMGILTIISAIKFHVPKKVKRLETATSANGTIFTTVDYEYKPRYEWKDECFKTASAILHACLLTLIGFIYLGLLI